MTDWILSARETNPQQAGTAYMSQAIRVARVTSCKDSPVRPVILYKALVRSHLEHAVSVWSPHHKLLIEKLEKVQKRATKLVIAVKTLKYEERLKYLNLPTLKYRRLEEI